MLQQKVSLMTRTGAGLWIRPPFSVLALLVTAAVWTAPATASEPRW